MNIAAYTSKYYLPTFLSLYDSIKNDKTVKLFVLCYDEEVKKFLKKKIKTCSLITTKDIEFKNPEIKNKKYNNFNEMHGVYRLAYAEYLLKKIKKPIHLIDSDIFFFDKPNLLNELVRKIKASVAFAKHNYFFNKKIMENKYGIYNAGYIYFNYDQNSLNFLKKYRKLCFNFISWETKKKGKSNFADQTYLEKLIKINKNVKIINHSGVNTAPWNIGGFNLSQKNNKFYVNGEKLIFYHFSGIRTLFNKLFFFNLYHYNRKNLHKVKQHLYKKYFLILKKNNNNFSIISKNKTINTFTLKKVLKKIIYKDFIII